MSVAEDDSALIECLQVEPTTRCNFNCGFCIGRHMEQKDLESIVLERILPFVRKDGAIELQGEGEPLMVKDFFTMLERCVNNGAREVSTITNGSLLDEFRARALVNRGLHHIAISLETPDENDFKRIRGGSWAKVRRGVETLIRVRGRKTNPTVGLAVAVLRSTIDALDSICDVYEEMGCDGGIMFQPLQAMPVYASIYDDKMQAEMLDDHQVYAFERWIEANPRARALMARADERSFYGRLGRGWTPREQTCRWLTRGLYVDLEGHASACCRVKNPAMAFGNIFRDSMASIMSARKEADQKFRSGEVPAQCQGCSIAGAIYFDRHGEAPNWDPQQGADQLIPAVRLRSAARNRPKRVSSNAAAKDRP